MTGNKKNIQVLAEFRRLFRSFTLFNAENFHATNRKKLLLNILAAFTFLISLVSLGVVIITAIWYCFDCNFNMVQASIAIAVSLGVIQMTLSYISFAMNNRIILKTIDHMQAIVESREY